MATFTHCASAPCLLFSAFWTGVHFMCLQPNKVYIGGLPENTRQEDLQSCFGKIGNIINIELKYVSPMLYAFPT
jgi:RNA recognition motif. (a.k.a. RRM, RBD, or RNP domain)